MVQMKVIRDSNYIGNLRCGVPRLYIPHGSDESAEQIYPVVEVMPFISHMVQMKVYLPCSVKSC